LIALDCDLPPRFIATCLPALQLRPACPLLQSFNPLRGVGVDAENAWMRVGRRNVRVTNQGKIFFPKLEHPTAGRAA
jgi:hypothetical protein